MEFLFLFLVFKDAVPKSVLTVKYGSHEVKLGNVLKPTFVKDPPTVTWEADSNKLYVLCMTGLYFFALINVSCFKCFRFTF